MLLARVPAEEVNLDGYSVRQLTLEKYNMTDRSGHSSLIWKMGSGQTYMVVFGGSSVQQTLLNDVQVLDVAQYNWITFSANSESCSVRPTHAPSCSGTRHPVQLGVAPDPTSVRRRRQQRQRAGA